MSVLAPVRWMDDYTPRAKAYWWTATLVGAAALALAVASVGQLDSSAVLQILGGTAIAALTGLFPVRIPATSTSLAGAELFIFLLLLVHGPPAAGSAATTRDQVGEFEVATGGGVWVPAGAPTLTY